MKTGMFLLAAAAAAAMAIGGASPARACVFDPSAVQKDIDDADVIFTGTVTETRHLTPPNRMEYLTMLSPDKVLKGRVTPDANVMVLQEHDNWSRYIYFTPGKKYLVVARGDRNLHIDGCSPVMALDPADAGQYEPGPEYKYSLAAALGEGTMFPMPKAPSDGARKRLEGENQDNPDNKPDSGSGGN